MDEATTEHGVPTTAGWFVINARDARWMRNDMRTVCKFGGEGPAHFQAARFFAVSLASLGLNILVLELLISNHLTGELVAQAIAVAVAMPFNFLGNKLWTFD